MYESTSIVIRPFQDFFLKKNHVYKSLNYIHRLLIKLAQFKKTGSMNNFNIANNFKSKNLKAILKVSV